VGGEVVTLTWIRGLGLGLGLRRDWSRRGVGLTLRHVAEGECRREESVLVSARMEGLIWISRLWSRRWR
jgi:hypothetical protein